MPTVTFPPAGLRGSSPARVDAADLGAGGASQAAAAAAGQWYALGRVAAAETAGCHRDPGAVQSRDAGAAAARLAVVAAGRPARRHPRRALAGAADTGVARRVRRQAFGTVDRRGLQRLQQHLGGDVSQRLLLSG